MKTAITIFQIILSCLLIFLIFLQTQDEDNKDNILSPVNLNKRGWEKILFFITIGCIALFLVISVVQTLN